MSAKEMVMNRQRQAGFTLIEVVIVVAILGIISAFAYNGYQRYVQNTYRADAQRSLMDIAQRLERCFTQRNDYSECVDGGQGATWESENGHYEISITDLEKTTFTLIATPQGVQAERDGDRCATLTLTHTGRRDSTGSEERDDCWGL